MNSEIYIINNHKYNKKMIFCSKCHNICEISFDLKQKDTKNNCGIFICKICGEREQIKPNTTILSRPSPNIIKKYMPINPLKINDPTYPLTRNYNCPNNTCITHSKPELKEAIFYRVNSTYDTIYVCKSCKTSFTS